MTFEIQVMMGIFVILYFSKKLYLKAYANLWAILHFPVAKNNFENLLYIYSLPYQKYSQKSKAHFVQNWREREKCKITKNYSHTINFAQKELIICLCILNTLKHKFVKYYHSQFLPLDSVKLTNLAANVFSHNLFGKCKITKIAIIPAIFNVISWYFLCVFLETYSIIKYKKIIVIFYL